MKKRKVIIFGLVIIALLVVFVDWHFPKTGAHHHDPTSQDLLYENLAIKLERPDYCEQISPFAYLTAGWGGRGLQVSLLKSDCYYKYSINAKNDMFCDRVQPINTWFLNGSKVSEADCIDRVAEVQGRGSNVSYGATSIPTANQESILSDLGYDYKNNPLYTDAMEQYGDKQYAVDQVWNSVFASDDFLLRLRQ